MKKYLKHIFLRNKKQIDNQADYVKISCLGDEATIKNAGNDVIINNAESYVEIYSCGRNVRIASTGYQAKINSSGDNTQIYASGSYTNIDSSGDNATICCIGPHSFVRAKKGSWITLSEWIYSEEMHKLVQSCVKTEYVDGQHIKEDNFYILKDGKFVSYKDY